MNSNHSIENLGSMKSKHGLQSSQVNPNSSLANLSSLGNRTHDHHPVFTNKDFSKNSQFASFQMPMTPPDSNRSTPFREDLRLEHAMEHKDTSLFYTKWLPEIDTQVVVLCLSWYFVSIVSSNSTKIILSNFKYPVTLTQCQFLFNSALCLGLLSIVFAKKAFFANFPDGSLPDLNEINSFKKFLSPNSLIISTTLPMGMFQFVGHITSHKATSLIPVSMVHTIKAISPITTVLIYRLLFGVKYKLITYVTLIPLVLGIMLTCYKPKSDTGSYYLKGLAYAFISMLIFVSQNIFAKKRLTYKASAELPISSHEKKDKKVDKLTILFYCSIIGFCFTMPIYIYLEFRNPVFSLNELSLKVVLLMSVNALSHFLQSLLAFQILGSITPINYSIANILKRIFIILIAFICENKNFSAMQSSGILLTIFGLYCYDKWGI